MKKNVAILPGDGIWPEVMDQACKVLDRVADLYGHEWVYTQWVAWGAAWEQYGEHFPEVTQRICLASDAILFGSVGWPVHEQDLPKWHNAERNTILALRKLCNFYANVRPATVYPFLAHLCPLRADIAAWGIDMVIIRELLGDLYFWKHETLEQHGERVATDEAIYAESEIRRIAHQWFRTARMRRKILHSIDKANVLDTSKLRRKVVDEVATQYPDVTYAHMLVDNAAMQLILQPNQFDVLLCSNMFGDILSDEASTLIGSIGMMPSASFSEDGKGLYEPAGGSAPDITGQDKANPIAQILCGAMMLEFSFGLSKEGTAIRTAVQDALLAGWRTPDIFRWLPGETCIWTQQMGAEITALLV